MNVKRYFLRKSVDFPLVRRKRLSHFPTKCLGRLSYKYHRFLDRNTLTIKNHRLTYNFKILSLRRLKISSYRVR